MGFLDFLFGSAPPPKVTVVRQRAVQPGAPSIVSPARTKSPGIIVQRTPCPYWQENGWVRNGQEYEGCYVTPHGKWPGSIKVSPGGRIEVYILNPPATLKNHPHWNCFMKRDSGWYFIHAAEPIKDISDAIISVETTITEAHEN